MHNHDIKRYKHTSSALGNAHDCLGLLSPTLDKQMFSGYVWGNGPQPTPVFTTHRLLDAVVVAFCTGSRPAPLMQVPI